MVIVCKRWCQLSYVWVALDLLLHFSPGVHAVQNIPILYISVIAVDEVRHSNYRAITEGFLPFTAELLIFFSCCPILSTSGSTICLSPCSYGGSERPIGTDLLTDSCLQFVHFASMAVALDVRCHKNWCSNSWNVTKPHWVLADVASWQLTCVLQQQSLYCCYSS